ncbi:MAG: hypothetical protein PHI79_06785 [Sulfurovaceae bacterium]|nr:hypothetical protein [Sulfurovaceae bacterium]MDD5549281.1 hypothetical protein [Sulfurovaceae bacterium]
MVIDNDIKRAYEHPDNKVLLSNYDMEHYNSYTSIVEEYRKTPNALMVYVRRDAYWENGMLDPSLFALCTQDKGKDHTQFWNFFDEHRRKN